MYGERIRSLRKHKKLTMKKLGENLNLAESTISGYENETRKPDLDTLNKFANFFEVNTDYLLGRTVDPSPTNNRDSHDMDISNVGRAFLGGAEKYSEEELDLARAAGKAAVEAYRKAQQKK